MPEAKVRGYTARRFSFNQAGGRCEACEGAGQKRIEMHFLPDVWVTCEACGGARYTAETLAVKFRGKTIADVLGMTVDVALEHFASVPKIRRVLQTLHDVGLGYVALGQAAPTLSGGEAQRVKLAAELARPDTGKTLYILDEPTTGLHVDDVRKLLDVVHRLADLRNTVVIIEHNLEVIKTADWVIDLGPEAGASGGQVVAIGPPEAVAEASGSLTGADPEGGPRRRPPRRAAEVRPQGRREEDHRRDPGRVRRRARPRREVPLGGRRPSLAHPRPRRAERTPRAWEGRILERIVDRIHELDEFAPTDWSGGAVVKIAGPEPGDSPFFHASTGNEWVVTLRFLVPRNTFKKATLAASLALTPFHESPTPVLCDLDRLSVANGKGATQEITITCHAAADVETPEFEAFLARAVASYRRSGKTGALVVASELR